MFYKFSMQESLGDTRFGSETLGGQTIYVTVLGAIILEISCFHVSLFYQGAQAIMGFPEAHAKL